MAKGIFTQGLVILLEKAVTLDEIAALLDGYEIVGRKDASEAREISGPALLVSYRPEQNACVSLDVYSSPWPDHMGDPKTDAQIFASWTMGYFGPYTYPGGLERSFAQSWRWSEAREAVAGHTAALRLRMSYVFGAGGDAKIVPAEYDPKEELIFLTKLAARFSELAGAICYFDPSGEVLLPFAALSDSLEHHTAHDLPPLDAWANVRLFNLNADWALMDCVGLGQLDASDHEVAFPKGLAEPQDVDSFIRNITLYLLKKGDIIKDGDTIDGPAGRKWQGRFFETGLNDPPRGVLRWLPCNVSNIPQMLLGDAPPTEIAKKPFWKIW
jgi:hypothetical protein